MDRETLEDLATSLREILHRFHIEGYHTSVDVGMY